MKILSNKKYNDLILKSCKGMFGAVTDDMLLRENALLYEENKQLKELTKDKSYCKECECSKDSNVLIELEKWLKEEDNKYYFGVKSGKSVLYGKHLYRIEVLKKIQKLKEKYK